MRRVSNPPRKKIHCYGNAGNTFRNPGEEPRTEAAMSCMMRRDEIGEEVSTPMEFLAKPKHIVRVAAWDVRSMNEFGRSAQGLGEVEKYKVNILGVSEMRYPDPQFRRNSMLFWSNRWAT